MQQTIAVCDVMVVIPAANVMKVIQIILLGTQGVLMPSIDPAYNFGLDYLILTVPCAQDYLDFFRSLGNNQLVMGVAILPFEEFII